MTFLRNLKLGTRLAAGFAVVLALLLIAIAVAVTRFTALGAEARQIVQVDWVKADAASILRSRMRANAARSLEVVIVADRTRSEQTWKLIEANTKEVDTALETLDRLVTRSDVKELLARVAEGRAKFVASIGRVRQLMDSGQVSVASDVLTLDALPNLDATQSLVDELATLQKRAVDESGMQIERDIAHARNLMFAVGAIGLIVGALFAWRLTRSITAPVAHAVRVARTVASGDLRSEIQVSSTDETGQLLAALKEMNHGLESVVGQVRLSCDAIAIGSTQIASGNADLSQRTEEQASTLQQTAASMEALTATVRQNADAADKANQLAVGASTAAANGGAVVERVVRTMEEITASARRIADITGVIDGIAFQTNILALNAAVEAARAGEQGRGFAVVAGEVRSLAQRSAEAAKEIGTLIGESVERVEAGSKLADEARRSMDDIVAQVKRVSDLIGEISSASLQQSSGIEQVGEATAQLDQATQQNAALVEEAAAAADSLKQQAEKLAELVAVFRLKEAEADEVIAQARQSSRAALADAAVRAAGKPEAASTTSTGARPSPTKLARADEGEWTSF